MTMADEVEQNGPHDIPPVDGMIELARSIDAIAGQRPAGDPLLPVVRFVGPGATRFVRGYGRRLRADGDPQPLVPHVEVGDTPGDDGDPAAMAAGDAGVRHALAADLRLGMPPGTGKPRLQAFSVLDALFDIAANDPAAGPTAVRDRLYDRVGRLGALTAAVAPGGADGPLPKKILAVLGGQLIRGVLYRLFGWRLEAKRLGRWIDAEHRRITGVSGNAFELACAVNLKTPAAQVALRRRILVLALLHDLDAATRRSWVSPRRRRRIAPFTLLVESPTPGSPTRRLLDELDALRRDAGLPRGGPGRAARPEPRRGTTLVLAAASPDDGPGGDVPGSGDNVDPALAVGDAAAELRAVPLPAALPVEVPTGPHQSAVARWLRSNPKIQPPRSQRAVLVPVACLMATALVVSAIVAFLLLQQWPPGGCPDMREEGGEQIGLNDGTTDCSFFADVPGETGEDLREVEATIAEENERAEELAGDQRVPTLVFLAPLTLPEEPERLGQTALAQLRGTATWQRDANARAENDANETPVRVLLANPGDRFRHGEEVTQDIIDRAAEDDSIVGVAGIGQSRDESYAAVRELGAHDLPVVAAPVTGDEMIHSSSHVYVTSPRNRRIAAMLTTFSRNEPLVRADGGRRTVQGAVIVMDQADAYSRNLANELNLAFSEDGGVVRERISYTPDSATAADDVADEDPYVTQVETLDQLADRVCTSLQDERDIVYFASRSQTLPGLLDDMEGNPDCGGRRPTVVAGSDVTKFAETQEGDLDGVDLYYAAFAAPPLDELPDVAEDFRESYVHDWGEDSLRRDMSDQAIVYDALTAMHHAMNQTLEANLDISADAVANRLETGQVSFDGASGYIALSGDRDADRVPDDKPVLVLLATNGQSEVELACGRFTRDDTAHESWGPSGELPCPDID